MLPSLLLSLYRIPAGYAQRLLKPLQSCKITTVGVYFVFFSYASHTITLQLYFLFGLKTILATSSIRATRPSDRFPNEYHDKTRSKKTSNSLGHVVGKLSSERKAVICRCCECCESSFVTSSEGQNETDHAEERFHFFSGKTRRNIRRRWRNVFLLNFFPP